MADHGLFSHLVSPSAARRLYHDLPPSLASRLAISVHKRMLSRCSFLAGLSDDLLLGVLSRLRPKIYVPGQMVLVAGQSLEALYFCKKGRVALVAGVGTAEETTVRVVRELDHFGIDVDRSSAHADDASLALQLLKPQTASESARAETYCDLISLHVSALKEIFAEDKFWSRLASERKQAIEKAPAAASSFARKGSFKPRLNLRGRFSKDREVSKEAAPAPAPMLKVMDRVMPHEAVSGTSPSGGALVVPFDPATEGSPPPASPSPSPPAHDSTLAVTSFKSQASVR